MLTYYFGKLEKKEHIAGAFLRSKFRTTQDPMRPRTNGTVEWIPSKIAAAAANVWLFALAIPEVATNFKPHTPVRCHERERDSYVVLEWLPWKGTYGPQITIAQ
jgi:hypothetical protein